MPHTFTPTETEQLERLRKTRHEAYVEMRCYGSIQQNNLEKLRGKIAFANRMIADADTSRRQRPERYLEKTREIRQMQRRRRTVRVALGDYVAQCERRAAQER